MAGRWIYKLMDTGEPAVEGEETKARKVWLRGAPTDVLHIEFRDGSSRKLSSLDENAELLPEEVEEPLEPADGRYWADLSASERRTFYYQDVSRVRRT